MNIEDAVQEELDTKGGTLEGTETIALSLNVRRKSWLREILRRLASGGSITIIQSRGGRGHKTVIKRNRNSPGQRRKIR
jgi:hypothetical protein